MKKLIYEIKEACNKIEGKTTEELNDIIKKIKNRKKKESLDNLLVDWFALTQEVSFREIGLRHFTTQLLGGIFLHQGKIVEMKTGEGKTLVSTLPVGLNALEGNGVHVVTVNEYLAERDQKWMGKIYKSLGLSVGLIKSSYDKNEKKKNYDKDITYLTNSELVFDYLRDSSACNLDEIVQRPFNFCLIDEIDSVLIDEARTPLILSEAKETNNINKLYLAKKLIKYLEKDFHFEIDEKKKDINLTEEGYKELKKRTGKETLYDPEDPWILEILNALKAETLFKRNKDYIILNNKIVIVDDFTGRIMEDRRWSMGLHESVEIKENIPVGLATKTKSSITYQNFFTLYPKLSGMTGTGKTTEKEFQDIYNLQVIQLPTTKPLIRKDLPDLVYQTELAKWKNVLEKTKECYEKGQPVLIGTGTIEKSEFLSELFKLSNIPHKLLNARPENVTRESEIVAQAGEKFAITIATNMAGRGTDIILGGNPTFKTKQLLWELLIEKNSKNQKKVENFRKEKSKIFEEYNKESTIEQLKKDLQNLPYSLETAKGSLKVFYEELYNNTFELWKKENKAVKDLGGLFVLGTERNETRRIDDQLRGRAGRQGDPGSSQFFVSLEDDLIKIFGGDNIRKWVDFLIQDKDMPLESNLLTKSLENAQKKVELYNYEIRKNIFQYDDILNSQRRQLFIARTELLTKDIYNELLLRFNEQTLDEEFIKKQTPKVEFEMLFGIYTSKTKKIKSNTINTTYEDIWITNDLRLAESEFYQSGFLKSTRTIILLTIIDFFWTQHIERMSYIRETINWRSYGQQNPLSEYNLEAIESFKLMFEQIRSSMLYYYNSDPINYQ